VTERHVTAHTLTLGVIGNPVGHSLSPQLQNALLSRLGVNGCYHAFEVKPNELEKAVRGASALGFLGLNVTVPFKEQVVPLCDDITHEAEALGAVNTLLFKDGRIVGTTTDPLGFLKPLEARGFELPDKTVVVLGAGGAARAVIFACAERGVAEIRLLNRTHDKAVRLVRRFRSLFPGVRIEAYPLLEWGSVSNALENADLIVNATSAGMWPHLERSPLPESVSLPRDALAYDLVYNPLRTRFLQQAEENGLAIQDGLDMLIYQAIASVEFWLSRQLGDWHGLARELRPGLERALEWSSGPPWSVTGKGKDK
jgi:shikimate dehydrogenase